MEEQKTIKTGRIGQWRNLRMNAQNLKNTFANNQEIRFTFDVPFPNPCKQKSSNSVLNLTQTQSTQKNTHRQEKTHTNKKTKK